MSEFENPLLPLVLQLLRTAPAGISEFELMKQIEADGAHFAALADEAQLALFQKHFLIMNALYRLQDSLWREEQLWLTISPLRIAIEIAAPDNHAVERDLAAHGDAALRDYYLDWQQFIDTDGAVVAELLSGFWLRFNAIDRRDEALAVLQLAADAGAEQIKQQYRRLARAAHPDRGGDAAQFLAIRAAYEILKN